MLKGTFELTIVQVEGIPLDDNKLGCCVSIDGNLVDVITPLFPLTDSNTVELPRTGLLQLVVRRVDSSGHSLGSASVHAGLLPADGFQWLSLQPEDNEFPSEMPLPTAKGPKLLVLISPKEGLSPVQETTEYSELENEPLTPRDGGNLQMKVTASALHKQRLLTKSYEALNGQLLSELAHVKEQLSAESGKLSELTGKSETILLKNREREDFLSKTIESRDKEALLLKQDLLSLAARVRSLECENAQLRDSPERSQAQSTTPRLLQELEDYKQKLEASENNRRLLQSEFNGLIAEWKTYEETDCIFTLEQENELLKNEIAKHRQGTRVRTTSFSAATEPVKPVVCISYSREHPAKCVRRCKATTPKSCGTDETDRALQKYAAKHKLGPLFEKQGKNTYKVHSATVNVLLKNGVLLCRAGGPLQRIEHYIKHLRHPSCSLHKQENSLTEVAVTEPCPSKFRKSQSPNLDSASSRKDQQVPKIVLQENLLKRLTVLRRTPFK